MFLLSCSLACTLVRFSIFLEQTSVPREAKHILTDLPPKCIHSSSREWHIGTLSFWLDKNIHFVVRYVLVSICRGLIARV